MERVNVSKLNYDLLKEFLLIKNIKNLDYKKNKLEDLTKEYLNLLLEKNLELDNIKYLNTLIFLIEEFYSDNFYITYLVKELKLKLIRFAYDKIIDKKEEKNKEFNKIIKVDHKENNSIDLEEIDGELYIKNKDNISLPNKGTYACIKKKEQDANGNQKIVGEYLIDSEGKIVKFNNYEEKIMSKEELNSIYNYMDDNLTYKDEDYINFISKENKKEESDSKIEVKKKKTKRAEEKDL